MAFDKKVFEKNFGASLGAINKAEKSVREILNPLSRQVLEAVLETEQIGYVNQLIEQLTPVNRNAAVEFYRHFLGWSYDETSKRFTTKSKKRHAAAIPLAREFLNDPLNNLFTWATRQKLGRAETEFVAVDFINRKSKAFAKDLQTARDHGISQKEMFTALFKGVNALDVDALVAVLAEMGEVNVVEEEAALM